MVKLPFFLRNRASVNNEDTAKSLLSNNCLGVVDSMIKLYVLSDQRHKVSPLLIALLSGKYGRIKDKYRMQLHVRVVICAITVNFDYAHALYHVKKARGYLRVKNNNYSPFEIMLFYCVYGWAHITNSIMEGSVAKGIISFNHVERVAPTCDKVAMVILTRVRQAMSIICKVTAGSVIEAVDRVVSLDDIAEHVPINVVYSCINAGFCVNPSEMKTKQDPLFYEFVEAYGLVEFPLCCKYERGNPETITKCVNEFISVYTNEAPKYRATEQDIIALEEKYYITFNRETLRFKHL